MTATATGPTGAPAATDRRREAMPGVGAGRQAPSGIRLVVVALGEGRYAVDIRETRPSVRGSSVRDGTVTLQGRVFPVVDLRERFGLPPLDAAARDRALVLLVQGTAGVGGLLVDGVETMVAIPEDRIEPLPAVYRGVERQWFRGLAVVGPHVIALLRVDGVLTVSRPPASGFGEPPTEQAE